MRLVYNDEEWRMFGGFGIGTGENLSARGVIRVDKSRY